MVNIDPINLAEKMAKLLPWIEERLKVFKKESHDLTIDCLNNVGKYQIVATIPQIKRKIAPKIPFYDESIRDVSIRALPYLSLGEEAVEQTEKGFIINPRKLPSSCEQYLITIEFDLPERAIKSIVDTRVETEPLENEDTFWMHAQIKNPDFVARFFDRIDIHDVEVVVRVGIANDIKISIPGYILETLETSRELLEEKNWYRKRLLAKKHHMLQRQYGKKIEIEKIRKLAKYCSPDKFKKYVIVSKPFRYDYCEPGKFYFDKLPISPIPATMKVITRTNLHKKRMAAEGKLIYKKKEFREGIVHMFA